MNEDLLHEISQAISTMSRAQQALLKVRQGDLSYQILEAQSLLQEAYNLLQD
jgi:predicted amino acid racemase